MTNRRKPTPAPCLPLAGDNAIPPKKPPLCCCRCGNPVVAVLVAGGFSPTVPQEFVCGKCLGGQPPREETTDA